MILCCGEALIDMIPTTAASGEMSYTPHPGGAVFNTSIALGRLGADVGLVSGVASDPFGELLTARLEKDGVDTSRLILSDRLTTLAMVHLKDGSATYSFYDENSAGRMIAADDAPKISSDVKALFFGGISLAAEPSADTYASLLSRWAPQRTVMMDPNIRPGFIADEARYRARVAQMIAKTDILKVSDEDLAWISDKADTEDAARALLLQGPSIVVVTKGRDGALAMTASDQIEVPSETIEVIDTVGAGDTFNAGFLYELKRRNALHLLPDLTVLEAALRTGAKAAAINCTRSGASPPTLVELNSA